MLMLNKNTSIETLISRVRTTIDTICNKIKELNIDVILCLEGASDLLVLSNGGHIDYVNVYTNLSDNELPKYLKKVDIDFSNKEIININGIKCTSQEQIILDMLEFNDLVSIQNLIEALANYYDFDNSFIGITKRMNNKQMEVFNKYKIDAMEYYIE